MISFLLGSEMQLTQKFGNTNQRLENESMVYLNRERYIYAVIRCTWVIKYHQKSITCIFRTVINF